MILHLPFDDPDGSIAYDFSQYRNDATLSEGADFSKKSKVGKSTAFQKCNHLIVQMQLRQWRVDLLLVLCPAQQIIDGNPIEVCQRDKIAMIDFLIILFFITTKG